MLQCCEAAIFSHTRILVQAKANDGDGPELLSSGQDGTGGHAESLAATLAEHRQHLASIQVTSPLHVVSSSSFLSV